MATTQGSGVVNNNGSFVYTWSNVTPGNPGNFVDVSLFGDKVSVQVEGTLGTSPSFNIEGSNDGVNPEIMPDLAGNALTKTAKGIYATGVFARYIRPNVTAGTGGTSLTFTLAAPAKK